MILQDGVIVVSRETSQYGQVKVLTSLDWAEVQWEGASKLELVHTSELTGPAGCRWFALCTNQADRLVPHPALGFVPCCARCAEVGA
ncbi:MAG TPA: hypothetical protein VG265_13450 [Gaiellaceae bacterium]|jgi:hypothetical protein|nr:hypothetical protein [Gaiellaceae bacterium]